MKKKCARRFCLHFGLLLVLLGLTVATAGCGGGEQTTAPTATTVAPTAAIPAAYAAKVAAARKAFEDIKPGEPGCSVAVGEDGEVVWAEGFGMADLETGQPITPDTVFDLQSTSKQFTATAVLMLVQEGKLDLDAPLSRYLPQLPSWAERISVRQLMHHQSGLPYFQTIWLQRDHEYSKPLTYDDAMWVLAKFNQPLTAEDALEILGEVRELKFEPGTKWEYEDSNYFLLAQVVESVTGQTFKEYLANRVFEPLGLKAWWNGDAGIPEKAASYIKDRARWVRLPANPVVTTGHAGLQTTPSDLVRWAKEDWAPTIGGPELLAARTEGAVPVAPGSELLYGAGILISTRDDGGPLLKDPGNGLGYRADLTMLPDERLAVAVTCNRSGTIQQNEDRVSSVIAAWRGS